METDKPKKVKPKTVLVSLSCNGRKVQAYVRGTIGRDGKTRVSRNDFDRLCTALGAERGQTISMG